MEQFVGMDVYEFDQQYHFSNLPDQIHFTLHEMEAELEHNILHTTLSSGSYSSYPLTSNTNFNTTGVTSLTGPSVEINSATRSTKQQRANNWTSSIMTNDFQSSSSSPNSAILSFETNSTGSLAHSQMLYGGPNDNGMGNFNVQTLCSEDSYENLQDLALNNANQLGKPVSRSTPPSQGQQDHIIAERKRREKLNQLFVALSALIPGLMKMDKASVLGDAIKYMKQLQERVEVLEEQTKKRTVESVVLFKKSQISADNDSSSSDEVPNGQCNSAHADIEARVSGKDVLIRVHCQKQYGVLVEILNEIEKLHLSIVNSAVLPFGTSMVDITVTCQMNENFSMAMNDVVNNLKLAFLKFK